MSNMKMKKILSSFAVIISSLTVIFTYAEASETTGESLYGAILEEKVSDPDYAKEPAEGYDFLNGWWKVGAIDYDYNDNPGRNMIIDINDSEGLSDLYDSTLLAFYADGTFIYYNLYTHEGTYTPHPKNPGCYILKTDSTYRLTLGEDGKLTKIESEGAGPSYYLEICEDSLHFQEYDPFTGKAKANDNGFYFVLGENESTFIQKNKVELESKDTEESSSGDTSLTSYEGILEIYTEKMKEAVPELVKEYKNESTGIYDITRLAEICNDKIQSLASICNEGVEKMAELMYDNGDSYDLYSSWAEKLMKNYMDIAQEITDAYLNSAM